MMISSSVVFPADGNPNTSIGSYTSDVTSNNDQQQMLRLQRLQCPCYKFTSLANVENLVTSDDQTKSMIDWLNGTTDRVAIEERRILSCGKRSQCRFRYGTAFVVLHAIRDVCVPYLNDCENARAGATTKSTTTMMTMTTTTTPVKNMKDHPAVSNILQAPSKHVHQQFSTHDNQEPNILMGRKKTKSKNSKRRVRPQLATNIAVVIDRPWGNVESGSIEENDPSSFLDSKDFDPFDSVEMRANLARTGTPNTDESVSESFSSTQLPPPTSTLYVTPTKGRIHGAPTAAELSPSTLLLSTPSSNVTESHYTKDVTVYREEAPIENVERLARIFVAMINNFTVPSTTSEIGLLLQLLTLRLPECFVDSKSPGIKNRAAKNTRFFSSIFSNPHRCVKFAQLVLVQIQHIIWDLPPFILSAVLQCGPIEENMPDGLRNCVTEAIDYHHKSSSSFVSISVEGNSSDGHAIFSLPFERDRDSRHNFTTQSEIALFKNREETRDAFLSLLRGFMTSKSKGFLPDQIERARRDAGQESKALFSRIKSDNIPWFAQFFVDLLLQIGMAPVEEMDQDVLQLAADKDKLQKLHRRLSAATSSKKATPYRQSHNNSNATQHIQSHRNSLTGGNTNLNGIDPIRQDGNNSMTTASPFHEALRYFPGYQEFFYTFLFFVDSHIFVRHLSRLMASMSLQLLSIQSAERGLEKRVCDLLLMGRFLGVVVFSPNWRSSNIDWNKIQPAATLDTLCQLESIGLRMPSLVQASWERGTTLTFVPWVTDLLKLAKWDTFSLASRPFRQVLANLRCIQQLVTTSNVKILHGQSMKMVSFALETFFDETFTLAKMTSLPQSNLLIERKLDPHVLDAVHVSLNKSTIFVLNPNIESLFNVIKEISETRPKTITVSPRKVRPSLIGSSQIQLTSIEDPETVDVCLGATNNKNQHTSVKKRLLASFFHLHRDIKDICDFCLSSTIKSVTTAVLADIMTLSVREIKVKEGISILNHRKEILRLSEKKLVERVHGMISDGINLFKPPNTHPKVIEIAIKVTADQGAETCMPRLRSLMDTHSMISDLRVDDNTSANIDDCHTDDAEKSHARPAVDVAFVNVVESMKQMRKGLKSNDVSKNLESVRVIIQNLQSMNETLTKNFPNEGLLRSFFSSVFAFDETISGQVISLVLVGSSSTATELLSAYLQMATLIGRHSKHAMHFLDKHLRDRYSDLIGLDLPESLLDQIKHRLDNKERQL